MVRRFERAPWTALLCWSAHARSLFVLIFAAISFAYLSPAVAQENGQTGDLKSETIHSYTETPNGPVFVTSTEFQSPSLDDIKRGIQQALAGNPKEGATPPSDSRIVAIVDSPETAAKLAEAIPRDFHQKALLVTIDPSGGKEAAATHSGWATREFQNVTSRGMKYGALISLQIGLATFVWLQMTEYDIGARIASAVLASSLVYAWNYHESFVIRAVDHFIEGAKRKASPQTPGTPNFAQRQLLNYPQLSRFAGSVAWGSLITTVYAAIASWDQFIPTFTHPQVWETILKAVTMASIGATVWQGWNLNDVTMKTNLKDGAITKTTYGRYRNFRAIQSTLIGMLGPTIFSIVFPAQGHEALSTIEFTAAAIFIANGISGAIVHWTPKRMWEWIRSRGWVRELTLRGWEFKNRLKIWGEQLRQESGIPARPLDLLFNPRERPAVRCRSILE